MDILDTCVMWALDYPKSIMNAEMHRAAAHLAVGRWRGAPQGIDGDRMQESGVVQIGGGRGGRQQSWKRAKRSIPLACVRECEWQGGRGSDGCGPL